MTAKKTFNKTIRFVNKRGMKFCTPLIFGSSSGGRNEAANACTPTIGVNEAYQSARKLPVPQKNKELYPAFRGGAGVVSCFIQLPV